MENLRFRSKAVSQLSDEISIRYYKHSWLRLILFIAISLASGGLMLIIRLWHPQVFTWIARSPIPTGKRRNRPSPESSGSFTGTEHTGGASGLEDSQPLRIKDQMEVDAVPINILSAADYALVYDRESKSYTECAVHQLTVGNGIIYYFDHHKQRYVQHQQYQQNEHQCPFEVCRLNFVHRPLVSELQRIVSTAASQKVPPHRALDRQLSTRELAVLTDLHSQRPATAAPLPNRIDTEGFSLPRMLVRKLFHPFYLFQIFSASVWFNQQYTTYAAVIIVLSSLSIGWELFSAYVNDRRLRQMVSSGQKTLTVIRPGMPVQAIRVDELVVGDVLELSALVGGTSTIPCDLILLNCNAIADESSLTGESTPAVRTSIASRPPAETPIEYGPEFKQNMLLCGTSLMQVKPIDGGDKAYGYVVSTGFATNKGELFRSILFPRPINFRFYRDAMRFLTALTGVALAAFAKRLYDGTREGQSFGDVLINSLDLITIAVPPALPLVLTVGVGFAISRLSQQGIFCIDPERVNFAGRCSVVCFDKTGTLTKAEMEFRGLQRCPLTEQSAQILPLQSSSTADLFASAEDDKGLDQLYDVMATCHGIMTLDIVDENAIQRNLRRELIGSHLDLDMFRATGGAIVDDVNTSASMAKSLCKITTRSAAYSIRRRYDFNPLLQRSSVVVDKKSSADGSGQHLVLAKGSAESIRSICLPESINVNCYAEFVERWSSEGYYVIACAWKRLEHAEEELLVALDDRGKAEVGLQFCGFLLFRNEIKPESPRIVEELHAASLQQKMITGDHLATAVRVARALQLITTASELIEIELVSSDERCEEDVLSKLAVRRYANHAAVPLDSLIASPLTASPAADVSSESPTAIRLLDCETGTLSPGYQIVTTGRVIAYLFAHENSSARVRSVIEMIVDRGIVFARVQPMEKTALVEHLIEYGHVVGMCGDGTNDCGALKAAHVGLSLSSAEASIVSPFTSKQQQVADVVTLVREGRCALTTSFLAFRFMTLYPLIQLMMAASLNHVGGTLSNNQYLMDDMLIVLLLSMTMLYTGPAKRLGRLRPTDDLLAWPVLGSVLGHVALCIAFFAISWALLFRQPWFCSTEQALSLLESAGVVSPSADAFTAASINGTVLSGNNNNNNQTIAGVNQTGTAKICFPVNFDDIAQYQSSLLIYSYENNVDWLFTHFQYLIVAFAINLMQETRFGWPWRRAQDSFRLPFYSNLSFVFVCIFLMIWLLVLLLVGPDSAALATAFSLVSWQSTNPINVPTLQSDIAIPMYFRWDLFGLVCVQFLLAIIWEKYLVTLFGYLYGRVRRINSTYKPSVH